MTGRWLPLALSALMLFVLVPLSPPGAAHIADESSHDHIIITEILVSPSGEDYNGTDWNGDGWFGSGSDQFIELYNPTSDTVNLGDWWLDDDPNAGSPPCAIGWNTNLTPGERIVFYRSVTGLDLSYFDGDTVQLSNEMGAVIDTYSFSAEDSDYDVSYGRFGDGSWGKVGSPTPGLANDQSWPQGSHRQGSCYTPNDQLHDGAYVLAGRVVTMASEDLVLNNGRILVNDGLISEIWEGNPPGNIDLTNVPVYETGGTIYPGLIDMHNHYHYNYLPVWDYTKDPFYTNRYQWKDNPTYKPGVSWPKVFMLQGDRWGLAEEAVKYAEVKSVVGGTTAIQGGPSSEKDAWADILARNIEHYNFGSDDIKTCAVCDAAYDLAYSGQHIIDDHNDGELDAWFVHVAEGTDASSLNEFSILKTQGLLLPETVLIHGVPLGASEFADMAAVGATLVWSPTSNLLLYGDTAQVELARAAGVNIALAPDWSPSGPKSVLHELKTADWWNKNQMNGIFSDYELAQMVTSNAADGMNWTSYIGRIWKGAAADFIVVDNIAADPYRNLIQAVDPDVRLTVVGGLPVFGDVDLMAAMKGADYEIIQGNGFQKAVDVTFEGVEDGSQTFEFIEGELTKAMRFDRQEMFDDWGVNSYSWTEFNDWLDQSYSTLGPIPLDPVFTYGDDRYFDVMNRSVPLNSHGAINLYDNYYNVSFDQNGNRTETWVPPPPDPNSAVEPYGWPPTGRDLVEPHDSAPRTWGSADTVPISPCIITDDERVESNIPGEFDPGYRDEPLYCGAVVMKRMEASGCWVEAFEDTEGALLDDSMLVWREPCPEGTTWTQQHIGMSEKPTNTSVEVVSRADPSFERGKMIGFPGQTCEAANVEALEPPIGEGEPYWAERVSNWVCVDSWLYVEEGSWPPGTGITDDGNEQQGASGINLLDPSSPLYWILMFVSLSTIFGSAAAIWVVVRRRLPNLE